MIPDTILFCSDTLALLPHSHLYEVSQPEIQSSSESICATLLWEGSRRRDTNSDPSE